MNTQSLSVDDLGMREDVNVLKLLKYSQQQDSGNQRHYSRLSIQSHCHTFVGIRLLSN